MFESKFHGYQSMKLQLSYEIVLLCTEIANIAFNSIKDN